MGLDHVNTVCDERDIEDILKKSVVRIIGTSAEGSGFPISEHEIITNYHVIEGEDSPKVVFPDGTISTPIFIKGSSARDIALLVMDKPMTPLPTVTFESRVSFGQPVFAGGYPRGSQIGGEVSIIKGSYSGTRQFEGDDFRNVQSDIQLIGGMSGGPLVNSCGQVVGVNTSGIGGISYFVDIMDVIFLKNDITDEEIPRYKVDLSMPEGIVDAYYYYIRVRDLKKAYDLLTEEKRDFESFERWQEGYKYTLQVELISSKVDEKDDNKVNIKLASADWVDGDKVVKFYEGFWKVNENGKLSESNIKVVDDPEWDWFWE